MSVLKKVITTGLASALIFPMTGNALAGEHYSTKTYKSSSASDSKEMMVRLIVTREDEMGGTYYERVKTTYSEVEAVRTELLSEPDVVRVEINMPMTTPDPVTSSQSGRVRSMENSSALYNDPLFSDQDYFDPDDQYSSRIASAHQRVGFPNKVRVGVIDGGFVDNPEAQFVEGVSFDFGRGPKYFNSDPETGCTSAPDPTIHGYQVGQVIGAAINNGTGIAGVADNVELVAARALDCEGSGFSFEISEAIRWLAGDTISDLPDISEPVDVINMSLSGGGACQSYTQDAIDFARAQGIPVVIAAGNDGGPSESYQPANCNGGVVVAATTPGGTVATYSNTGSNVDIAAQGSEIYVLDETGAGQIIYGTSFAAPILTGGVLMTLSESPSITPASFDLFISRSGRPVSDPANESPQVGAGIFDAMLLLDNAGSARETVGLSSVVTGEREQYADALLHPAAETFLNDNRGTGACDLAEVRSSIFAGIENEYPLTVFSVPDDEPLVSDSPRTPIVSDPSGDRLVVSVSELVSIQASGKKLGISKCDEVDGSTCTVSETVLALDANDIQTAPSCS